MHCSTTYVPAQLPVMPPSTSNGASSECPWNVAVTRAVPGPIAVSVSLATDTTLGSLLVQVAFT